MKKTLNRIISALLTTAMVFTLLPVFSITAKAVAGTAPNIYDNPRDATYSSAADARFSITAQSNDGGSLTYAWYRSHEYSAPVDGANGTGKDNIVNNQKEGGLLGTKSVLLTTTPANTSGANKYYYYWCEVTNHKTGFEAATRVSSLALIKVVSRTLEDHLINGEMNYWQSNDDKPYLENANHETHGSEQYLHVLNNSLGYSDGAAFDAKNGWFTTHAQRYRSKAGIIEIGWSYNYWNSTGGTVQNLYSGRGNIAELGAGAPSSLYQDIATVPGKIYEWSFDHSSTSSVANAQTIALVIGKAINEHSDYGAGVTDRWQKNGAVDYTDTGNGYYPYGVNQTSYFNDIVAKLVSDKELSITDNFVPAREYTQEYNGSTYYIYIGTAPRNNSWQNYKGVYTVPRGQGTTTFGFVYVYPTGNSNGNLLDNVVFGASTLVEQPADMTYTGETQIEVETKAGYAYALLELRGSSLNTISPVTKYNNNAVTPDTGNGWLLGSVIGFANGGSLVFSDLVPGKSYRVIGIPEKAINTGLHTNEEPRDVLDDGYYYDTKIKPIYDSDSALSAISMRVELNDTVTMTLANTNVNTQYALLTDVAGAPSANPAIPGSSGTEWTVGSQTEVIWENLAKGTTYWIVARPLNYDEIDYATAAYDESGTIAALKVVTPNTGSTAATEIVASDVKRVNGTTITVDNTLAAQKYAIADILTGNIVQELTGTGGTLTFSTGIDASKTYQVVTKTNVQGDRWIEGVRVYPYPAALGIDYVSEQVRLAGGNIPATISYSFETVPATWTEGSGVAPIQLQEAQLNGSTVLTYRVTDEGYTGAKVYPTLELDIDARPSAPAVTTNFTFDFANEKVHAVTALQYRIGNTVYDVTLGNDVTFATLGWTGAAAKDLSLRLPADSSHFASQYTTTTAIPARPRAPSVIATKVDTSVSLNGLTGGVSYEWYKNDVTSWTAFTANPIDTVYNSVNKDNYTVRYAATGAAPASYAVTIAPEPLYVAGVNFGTYIYGNNPGEQFFQVKNNEGVGDVVIQSVAVTGDFTLSYTGGTTLAPGVFTDSTYSVTPSASLAANTYEGEITVTYTHDPDGPGGNDPLPYTAKSKVYLTVEKAQWNMNAVVADVKAWPPSGFELLTYGNTDNAILKFRLGLDDSLGGWKYADSDNAKIAYNGLNAASTYVVYVRAEGDANHYESAVKELVTVHTIHATPTASDVVYIDYENETLLFKSGNNINAADYEVTINGSTVITHGGSVSNYADAVDGFDIIVKHKASGADDRYGASEPSAPLHIVGRVAAPADVTTHYATDASTPDGTITRVGGAFRFIVDGGNWASSIPSGTGYKALVSPGTYLVRIPATSTVFASKAERVTVQNLQEMEELVDETYSKVVIKGVDPSSNEMFSIVKYIKRSATAQTVALESELPNLRPTWILPTAQLSELTLIVDADTTAPNPPVTIELNYVSHMTTATVKAVLADGTYDTSVPGFVDIVLPVEIGSTFTYTAPSISGYQNTGNSTAPITVTDTPTSNVIKFYYLKSSGNLTVIATDGSTEIGRVGRTVNIGTIDDSDAQAPTTGEIPALVYYNLTPGSGSAAPATYDGLADNVTLTYTYTKKTRAVTLEAWNTVTNDQIGSYTHNTAAQPVLEAYDYSGEIAGLTSQLPTDYTLAAQNTFTFVFAAPTTNVVKVWYNPPQTGVVTVNVIDVSNGNTLLLSYKLPAATGERVTITPSQYPSIAGYTIDEVGSTLSAVAGNAITIMMTDNRKTITVSYVFEGTTPPTRANDTYKVVVNDPFTLTVPYIAGYVLKSYKIGTAGAVTAASVPSPLIASVTADTAVSLTYQTTETSVDANYATITFVGHKDGQQTQVLYSVPMRLKKGEPYTFTQPTGLMPEWKLKSTETSKLTVTNPTADDTVYLDYEKGTTTVIIKSYLYDTSTPLINDVLRADVEIGTDKDYYPPVIPGYALVVETGGGATDPNPTAYRTLTNVTLSNNIAECYYKPATGNLTVIGVDKVKGYELYRESRDITVNGSAVINTVAQTAIAHYTSPVLTDSVSFSGTGPTPWSISGTPTDIVLDPTTGELTVEYTRELTTAANQITLKAINADGGAPLSLQYAIPAGQRVGENHVITAAEIKELDDLVTTGVRVGAPGPVLVTAGAGSNVVEIPYNVYSIDYITVELRLDDVANLPNLTGPVIHSYKIALTTPGTGAVSVDPSTIVFEGYEAIPNPNSLDGSYSVVATAVAANNVILIPMTDIRYTVAVYDTVTTAQLSETKYATTLGREIVPPFKSGYVATGYQFWDGNSALNTSWTPISGAGVPLTTDDDYKIVFRYETVGDVVAAMSTTVTVNFYLHNGTLTTNTPVIASVSIGNVRLGGSFPFTAPAIPGYKLVNADGTDGAPGTVTIPVVATGTADTITFYYKILTGTQVVICQEDDGTEIFRKNVDVTANVLTSIPVPAAGVDELLYYDESTITPPIQQSVTWNGDPTSLIPIIYKYARKTVVLTLTAYDSIMDAEVPGANTTPVSVSVRVGEPYDFSALLSTVDVNVNTVLASGDVATRLAGITVVSVGTAALDVRVFYKLKSSLEDAVANNQSVITIIGKENDTNGAVLYEHVKVVTKSSVATTQVILPADVFNLTPRWYLINGQDSKMIFAPDGTTGTATPVEFYYEVPSYTITATAGPNGSISPGTVTDVQWGGNRTFFFTPDSGYQIDSVTVDGTQLTVSPLPASYEFTNVTDNSHSIAVTFAAKTYDITASASAGGTITGGVTNANNDIVVAEGTNRIFTANLNENWTFAFAANGGYHIESVAVDGIVQSATTSPYEFLNVTENHTITVVFARTSSGGGGGGGGSSTPDPKPDETKPAEPEKLPVKPPTNDWWFIDVPQVSWFYDDVRYVYELGLFTGTGADTFSPTAPTTRGMLVTVLYRLAGEPSVNGSSPFGDVNSDRYYAVAVAWASANGIVNGVGGNKFEPDRNISRQELATIIIRYIKFAGLKLNDIRGGEHFADDAAIAEWANAAVDELYKSGIVNGKDNNRFDPRGEAIRAEVAAILHRLIESVTAKQTT
ncbi:MAG: S-layer homology domain-containing protein [Oscillospiraceae bacterium]|nr:S-layer homology domain-containing protein [Oscillospiraceae bacterium]